jgi:hypothetical protein
MTQEKDLWGMTWDAFRAAPGIVEIPGFTRKIQGASVNDPVTKGKRLPKFWAGRKAFRKPRLGW